MAQSTSTLHTAKKAKNDEFYTMLSDIENEMKHYKSQFKGKKVFCNCDDRKSSAFAKYFAMNFNALGLKSLTTTHYNDHKGKAVKGVMLGDTNNDGQFNVADLVPTVMKGDGDFRSEESLAILAESDIVVSNPPFSLFREFMDVMQESGKKFLLLGNNNAITYKNVFAMIMDGNCRLGVNSNKTMEFVLPDHYAKWNRIDENGNKIGKVPAISWFTNLKTKTMKEEIVMVEKYSKDAYPKYDNLNAINVDKVKAIPKGYKGLMGVPITFLTKYNPNQFEIVSFRKGADGKDLVINGKAPYFRIIIKAK